MDTHNLIIDTVKEEKANAIARYRRFRNFKKLLQLIELFVVITLFSWSSTCLPSVVKLTGDFFLRLSLSVSKPHVVFFIGNAIIAALFFLSRQIGTDSSTAADADINDDVLEFSNSISEIESPPSINTSRVEIDVDDSEKQIVCIDNAARTTECEAVTNAIEKATKEIQKLERTQSERAWRRESPVKELRRSETQVQRTVLKSRGERETIDKVESLSNEEFRLTVEAFIQKQQNFLRLQKMAEIDSSLI